MEKLVLVKLGGSLITDKTKPYVSRPRIICRLAREIKQALSQRPHFRLILIHGVGSFAHTSAAKYQTAKGFSDARGRLGACITHHDAARINRILIREFLTINLPVATIPPSSIFVASNYRPVKRFFDPIITLAENGIIPVLYGDVIWDRQRGSSIYSGEVSLGLLAQHLIKQSRSIKQIIQCGIEDGVYRQSDKKIIPFITIENFKDIKRHLGGSGGIDVTGGMLHKVEEALKLTKLGIETMIINGKMRGNLKKAILGQKVKGTVIR